MQIRDTNKRPPRPPSLPLFLYTLTFYTFCMTGLFADFEQAVDVVSVEALLCLSEAQLLLCEGPVLGGGGPPLCALFSTLMHQSCGFHPWWSTTRQSTGSEVRWGRAGRLTSAALKFTLILFKTFPRPSQYVYLMRSPPYTQYILQHKFKSPNVMGCFGPIPLIIIITGKKIW